MTDDEIRASEDAAVLAVCDYVDRKVEELAERVTEAFRTLTSGQVGVLKTIARDSSGDIAAVLEEQVRIRDDA